MKSLGQKTFIVFSLYWWKKYKRLHCPELCHNHLVVFSGIEFDCFFVFYYLSFFGLLKIRLTKRKKSKKERKREERKLVKTMAKLRMAHASTHGARKPPGPILSNISYVMFNSLYEKLDFCITCKAGHS